MRSDPIRPHRQTRQRHNARPPVWTIVLASHSLLFPGLPLHSARLVLSPIRRDDAAALFTLQSNPDVMRWWNHPAWTRLAEAREQIDDDLAAHAIGTQLKLAVRESLEGPLLGICVVFAVDRDAARAEIGYLLAPDRQGQGLYARGPATGTGLPVPHPAPAPGGSRDRPAQCAVRARAGTPGLPARGVLRQRWRIQGQLADSAVYGLLADDDAAAILPA